MFTYKIKIKINATWSGLEVNHIGLENEETIMHIHEILRGGAPNFSFNSSLTEAYIFVLVSHFHTKTRVEGWHHLMVPKGIE